MDPRTIVPLKTSQICRGSYSDPKGKPGCGCLAFHSDRVFGFSIPGKFYDALNKAAKVSDGDSAFFDYNKKASKLAQARAFNRALIRIGYKRRGKLLVWAGKPKPRKSAKAVQS